MTAIVDTNKTDHLMGLLRHFADLRDGVHGDGAVSRKEKEALFASTVKLLDNYARQALEEMNRVMLLHTGSIVASGLTHTLKTGVEATWFLTWPEQEERRLPPVTLNAFFATGFHHPHLRGATTGNWPLNVFNCEDAAIELPTLRAIACADLHNLVFQSDYRIIPATKQRA